MECGGVSSLFVIVGIGLFYLEHHKDANLQEILFLSEGWILEISTKARF